MDKKTVSGIILTLLLIVMFNLPFNVQKTESSKPSTKETFTPFSDPPETRWNRTYGGIHHDQANFVVQTRNGGCALSGLRPPAKGYIAFAYAVGELHLFSYHDGTAITVKDASGTVVYDGMLNEGEHAFLSSGSGVYLINGTRPYSVLCGDPTSDSTSGFYAIDENGKGTGTKFYTFIPSAWDSRMRFIVFAYMNDTDARIVDTDLGVTLWAGTLDEREHFEANPYTNASWESKYVSVISDKPISALTYFDQGYGVPSSNGLFTGTLFYTYASYVGSWVNDLNVIGYFDSTTVTVKNTVTGTTVWSGIIDEGEVHTEGFSTGIYITVESDKDVAVTVDPFVAYTSDYHAATYVADSSGERLGTLFYATARSSGYLEIFAYQNVTSVSVTNLGTGSVVWTGTLDEMEHYSLSANSAIYKIEASNYVSIMEGYGVASAEFAPLYFAMIARMRDVATIEVAPSSNNVTVGQSVMINVTVKNQGNVNETFNVDVFLSVYANTTFLGNQTVLSLAPNATKTLTYTWNTTDFLTGPYKFTAIAQTVSNEIDTADNAYTYGMVKVQTDNMHELSVFNRPAMSTLLPFLINNTRSVAPWLGALNEGTYMITMPSTITDEGVVYDFESWEDNATAPTRTINLAVDTDMIAYYDVSSASLPVIHVDPAVITAAPNKDFEIDLAIANVTNLYSWELKLYYDTRFMDAVSAAEGSFFYDGVTTFEVKELNDEYNTTHGCIWLNCALIETPYGVNGSGTLATIVFQAAANGNSILSIGETNLRNSLGLLISHKLLEGVGLVRIKLRGDVNNDGVVDLYDLTIVGTAWDSRSDDQNWNPHADIDGDGHVFLYDLTIVGTDWEKHDC